MPSKPRFLSRSIRRLSWTIAVGALQVGLAAAEAPTSGKLPPTVLSALQEAGIPTTSVGIVVQSVDGGPPLVNHQSRQAMNPASAMKLVTTYAALELLGPAHSWRTEALITNPPRNGRLDGPLYLRGGGDPKLALEHFWLLLRQIRSRGVSEINGDLILDRSAFVPVTHDPGEFDREPLRPYNAGPDALLINLKSLRLTLQPEPARNRVNVLVDTPAEGVRVANRLSLGREGCGDWREQIRPAVSGQVIELAGSYPAACGEKALHLAPWPADQQVDSLFRALWRELGGSFAGRVREGRAPGEAQTLATHESPPLGEIVREINKYSNNVMARQVFLSLDGQRPATADGARRQIVAWLQSKGLKLPELVLDNGSGLSRSERISAEGLAQILLAAWRSPVMPELIASLPIAGVDGTLRKRLGNGSASGRAHLKTGYLDGVRALAGYVLDNSGRRWIVVFLLNDPNFRLGKPAMDALLLWVAKR